MSILGKHPRWAALAAGAAVLVLSACGASSSTAAGRVPTASSTGAGGPGGAPPGPAATTVAPDPVTDVPASSAPASSAATTVVPATTAPAVPGTPPSAGPAPPGTGPAATTTTLSGCQARLSDTFIRIATATAPPGGGLDLTANPTTLVCGGPDDLHYVTDTAVTETGHVLSTATVQTFPVTASQPATIPLTELPAYLATDTDTKVFLVTGPLDAISGLQEQFHP